MRRSDFLGSDPFGTAASLSNLARDMHKLASGWKPDAQALEAAPLLHGWGFAQRPRLVMTGAIFDHPSIAYGSQATTSEVFAIDPDRQWVRTFSRFYVLGPSQLFGLDG